MDLDALLTHCRLADGHLVNIGIAGGRIAMISEDTEPSLSNRLPILDIGGDLVLPGLVDGHMHLDKTSDGAAVDAHAAGPTRMSRIETDKVILPHLSVSTEERSGNLIEECVARGTAHLRTHVDVDLESGLSKLDGVLAGASATATGPVCRSSPFRKAASCAALVFSTCSTPQCGAGPIWSAGSTHWRSIVTRRANWTAFSLLPIGMALASTSICTSQARWGCSMSMRSAPALAHWACAARSRSATVSSDT